MNIEVKCYATLSQYEPDQGSLEMQPGATLGDVLRTLSIPSADVKIMFINGHHSPLDKPLQDNDRVGIFPAIGGG
ncbi:MoaD/ThiS family protein [Desulfonatronovibrio magnus]|uniref:MoaD/ThiS family protein n=1 Tax=Desulfonatronovibrio magnus TaxID=698827 RepID=UPI0005EB531C|nr:MoaD/ThiS family protein [Desulfonatronovibrio magnus]